MALTCFHHAFFEQIKFKFKAFIILLRNVIACSQIIPGSKSFKSMIMSLVFYERNAVPGWPGLRRYLTWAWIIKFFRTQVDYRSILHEHLFGQPVSPSVRIKQKEIS